MDRYQPQQFEGKWRKKWWEEKLYRFRFDATKKKFYVLVELPYTSGDLHIGHWFTFTTPDVVARFKRMGGFNVFFPIGYDAFGLPAENAAIKRGIHPQDWTMKNIETMTKQFALMGSMINNWEKVVVTCLPEYYRFNQWIFIQMFKKGLIYQGKALSNWCPSCQTVLANENVVDGKCWRCGSPVEQKEVPQWFIKITAYADRLIWPEEPAVDWPESVREGQNNWIGKSQGTEIKFKIQNSNLEIKVFTTRADTLFGATAIILAPEHFLVKEIENSKFNLSQEKLKEIDDYITQAKSKQEEERLKETKEKTGVDTGLKAVHPLTSEEIPIWIADYVLGWYGEGAVMLVPAHDQRDFDFAKKFNLPVKEVIVPEKNSKLKNQGKRGAFTDFGILVNSGQFSGLTSKEAIEKITQKLQKLGLGQKRVVYHLRDWSISRQRYWGTPIPIIYCHRCWEIRNSNIEIRNQSKTQSQNNQKMKEGVDYVVVDGEEYMVRLVPEKDLPVKLPYDVDFTPKGKPPLATNEKWLKTKCPVCGGEARRDAQTLDTFFDSSWYWFRYISPDYDKGPFDKQIVAKLTPVDIYFGGAEHTLGHTLYARFFTKFFHDLGLVDYEEFALKRVQHGVVLGPDGNKMSKSKGNVVNPDEQVKEYGADVVRMYLCFMMPYEGTGPWSDETIAGVYRFLARVWKMFQNYKESATQFLSHESLTAEKRGPLESEKNAFASSLKENQQLVAKLKKTIIKVTRDIEKIKLNTAIAAMMEFVNEWEKLGNGNGNEARIVDRQSVTSPNNVTDTGLVTQTVTNLRYEPPNRNPNRSTDKKIGVISKRQMVLSIARAKEFLKLLAPFAPFITEEIWREVFGEKTSIHLSSWPKVEGKVVEEEVTIPVQVNGKLRATIKVQSSKLKVHRYVEELALKEEKVKKYLGGRKYQMIYVEGKIVNFVAN